MQAKLKSTPKTFFKDYVNLLNPLLKLRKREAEVLEAHLRVYYINHRLPDIDRLLFSSSTQRTIRNELGMSPSSYNNHKARLRANGSFVRKTINPLIITKQLIDLIKRTGKVQLTYQLEVIKTNVNQPKGLSKQGSS